MNKKKKFLRVFLILVAVIVIIGIVGITVVLANLDAIVEKSTEKVLSYVLEVDVTLEKADVSLLGGSCKLEGLVIGNPERFKTDNAFSVEEVFVELDLGSFKTDEPVVKLVEIRKPHITMEQGLRGSNWSTLIKSASRFEGEEAPEEDAKGAKKKIRIDKVIVDNASVSISAPMLQGKAATLSIPRFEMDDVGGAGKRVSVAESIKIFFTKIMETVLKQAGGVVPSDLIDSMGSSLGDVTEGFQESLSGAADTAKDASEKTTDQLKKGGEELKEGVEGVGEGIKGLFGKDKDE